MRPRRAAAGFNLAFLDIMSCGLGAVVLVFMLVRHQLVQETPDTVHLQDELQQLQIKSRELDLTLDRLRADTLAGEEETSRQKERVVQLRKTLAQQELELKRKQTQLADMKKDISPRDTAEQEDLVADDRGGEENYLIGLKVEGRRIAVLLDTSASMTDEKLLAIIRRKNSSAVDKKNGPKWQRAKNTVRWLLARLPRDSQVTVIAYNGSARSLGGAGWISSDSREGLKRLYRELDGLVPEGPTNLQLGLQALAGLGATDLYLVTDGMPTAGESRYRSLNPFASCSSLLGKSSTITGECRVKLFRQTIKDSGPRAAKVNVILLPIEGDPDAVNEYWSWAAVSGGLVLSPAVNWP